MSRIIASNVDLFLIGKIPCDFDDRFKYKLGKMLIQRIYTGTMWAEGPAWNGVGEYLIWTDIPNNEQLRWTDESGHVSRKFRFPSGNSNGNTLCR